MTLETLTEKIQKYCPELLECTLGCKIKNDTSGNIYTFLHRDDKNAVPKIWIVDEKSGEPLELLMWNFGYFVLGHPITLEHVLKAIKYGSVHLLAVRDDGVFMVMPKETNPARWLPVVYGKDNKRFVQWRIAQTLSEQSPETIEWLNSVIE